MRRLGCITTALLLLAIAALAQGGQGLVQTGDPEKRGLKQSDFPRWKELAPGVYSYEALRPGDPGGFMTTVSMFVVTTDGVLVADGQGNLEETQKMIDNIKKITPQPIKYVVICSDHGDHTGGNAAFKTANPNVVFVSSPVSQKVLANNANPPTETVADKRSMKMGKTEIQILNLGRAHTGGDLTVYVPNGKVLFMSEAYLHRIFPAMRSAFPSEWIETVKKAQKMNATWYIPGHGFVDDAPSLKAELDVYRKSLEYVFTESKRLHDAKIPCEPAPAPAAGGGGRGAGRGAGGERGAAGGERGAGRGAAAAPAPCEAAQKANWGPYAEWTLRSGQAQTAILKVYEELDGKLPAKPKS
jgi:glyoxylase-like metal-dependent hydrolase (beta-lactamase superfamily II)